MPRPCFEKIREAVMSLFEGFFRFCVVLCFVLCLWDDSQITNAFLFAILVELSYHKVEVRNNIKLNIEKEKK